MRIEKISNKYILRIVWMFILVLGSFIKIEEENIKIYLGS